MNTGTWTVAEAKAKFSEVIERAQSGGPQTITRNGRTAGCGREGEDRLHGHDERRG